MFQVLDILRHDTFLHCYELNSALYFLDTTGNCKGHQIRSSMPYLPCLNGFSLKLLTRMNYTAVDWLGFFSVTVNWRWEPLVISKQVLCSPSDKLMCLGRLIVPSTMKGPWPWPDEGTYFLVRILAHVLLIMGSIMCGSQYIYFYLCRSEHSSLLYDLATRRSFLLWLSWTRSVSHDH